MEAHICQSCKKKYTPMSMGHKVVVDRDGNEKCVDLFSPLCKECMNKKKK